MLSDEHIDRWPEELQVLALALEASQARAWAERMRWRDDGDPDADQRQLTRCLENVRRLLLSQRQNSSNAIVAATQAFADSLAEHGDKPPEGQWPESEHVLRVLRRELHAGLQPAPVGDRDWARRTGLLAKRSWIGGHAGSCPAGWVPLLERAVSQAERWVPRAALKKYHTSQIKEKFGSLRWYIGSNELLSVIVDFAELTSEITCLACGEEGKLRTDRGWILTLCDVHDELDRRSGPLAVSSRAYPHVPE